MTRLAFLAPLKPPDHPEPSGDRQMARSLVTALGRAGFEVELASRLRMLDRHGDSSLMEHFAADAKAEASALIRGWLNEPEQNRPSAVFTYHVHYKAPDVIGPLVAQSLRIPYIVAEGSRAPKRRNGPWARGHALAEAALDAADAIFVLNENDRPMLETHRPASQRLPSLAPFLDARGWPDLRNQRTRHQRGEPVRLLAVGMMRTGAKLKSYRVLADALTLLPDHASWTLTIAGDGPARPEIEALFARFGHRIDDRGLVSDPRVIAELYATHDLFVWPAVDEAYGMVFLEAGLQGCPALAGRSGGVPGVVADGRTGVLVPEGDPEAFAAQLGALVARPDDLIRMGSTAANFVRSERSIEQAIETLRGVVSWLVARKVS